MKIDSWNEPAKSSTVTPPVLVSLLNGFFFRLNAIVACVAYKPICLSIMSASIQDGFSEYLGMGDAGCSARCVICVIGSISFSVGIAISMSARTVGDIESDEQTQHSIVGTNHDFVVALLSNSKFVVG